MYINSRSLNIYLSMYKIEGTNCISDKYTPKILNYHNKFEFFAGYSGK